jgi:hypothetical protein
VQAVTVDPIAPESTASRIREFRRNHRFVHGPTWGGFAGDMMRTVRQLHRLLGLAADGLQEIAAA